MKRLIVEDKTIVTMNPGRKNLENYSVEVAGNRIVDIYLERNSQNNCNNDILNEKNY